MRDDGRTLLEYPFDMYQRYQVTADLLEALDVADGTNLLDVGGAPGPTEAFLGRFVVTVLDPVGEHDGRFVRGDGTRLPFADDTFETVVSHDTLEHVPAGARSAFLSEMLRVARDVVVLCAPFASRDIELAEAALGAFVERRIGSFPTLDEHSEYGLPDLQPTVRLLATGGWATATLPSGYLPRWLAGMLVHHELLASGVEDLGALHAYYNSAVSPSDCREPAYRHVLVAARDRGSEELGAVVDQFRCDTDTVQASTAVQAIAGAVFSEKVGAAFRGPFGALEQKNDDLKRQLDDVERQLVDRDAHIMELRSVLDMTRLDLLDARDALASAKMSVVRRAAKRLAR